MIKFIEVTKFYPPSTYAVKNINLYIRKNEFVCVIGKSGSGKSTLIKLLIGEEKPTKGKIIIENQDITKLKKKKLPYLRRKIGIVFQDYKLLPKKTVFENVSFTLEVLGYSNEKIKEIVPTLLKVFNLYDKKDKFPYQLSGGEKQRVAIARAIAHRPKILAADEPTGNLDSINTKEIIDLLLKINRFGTTIFLVTHNKDIVNFLRKRVITLESGRIVGDQKIGRYFI